MRVDAFSSFSQETAAWFQREVGEPTEAQRQAWPLIHAGGPVLVSAPTGTGKTLAAFLGYIDALHALHTRGELLSQLYVVYVSPLKALAADIRENLQRPLHGLGALEIQTFVRTGDTTQAQRRDMIAHPPHILITTPESLYLLLTSESGRNALRTAMAVIVDEMHALISTKRGTHLSLSLARLDALCGRRLQRVGLSATVTPLETAAEWLSPDGHTAIVSPPIEKKRSITVSSAPQDMRVLPQNSIWPEIANAVIAQCEGARAVIAFLEGRAQAEKLSLLINERMGDDFSRTHHGSVSKEQRHETEMLLREGRLRLLCATSSMELGIDVGRIDLVIQVGCPFSISGALQRLGRAGHSPGRVSEMRVYPVTPMDAVHCALTVTEALSGRIERAHIPMLCLDVLAQHLVSMACGACYTVDEALSVARAAYPYRAITREDVEGVLRMLAGDYEHEMDHPVRARVLYDRVGGTVRGDTYSRMLAVSNAGVIPDRGMYPVVLTDGTRLGELDEEFVFEARLGDRFMLGAFAWRIDAIERDRVVVSRTTREGAQSPFWKGDGRGRDFETALRMGASLRALGNAGSRENMEARLSDMRLDPPCCRAASALLTRQTELTDGLPDDRTIIVERLRDEAGEHQVMVHSLFGRPVNIGLAMLLSRQALLETGVDARAFEDDDGVLLYMLGVRAVPEGLLLRLNPDTAAEEIERMLPATPLFSMRFRYDAACAMMTGMRKLGKRQPLWVQRLRGAEALSQVAGDRAHPLMREALRECLNDDLDLSAIARVLRGIRSGDIAVREVEPETPSPMSLPFRREVEATMMYDYAPVPRSAIAASLPGAAGMGGGFSADSLIPAAKLVPPDARALSDAVRHVNAPLTPDGLHARLMAEGDLEPSEAADMAQWLDELAHAGRAMYIEPGLWIAAEEAELYRLCDEGDAQARARVARRLARYHGGQDGAALAARYGWPEEMCAALLEHMAEQGQMVLSEGVYYHADLWRQASRACVHARRDDVQTCAPECYALLCAGMLRAPGDALQSLRLGLRSLMLDPQPAPVYEQALLPARTSGYRPAMLDELLSGGDVCWRLLPGDKPLIQFHEPADEDMDGGWPETPDDLSVPEQTALRLLRARGASFLSAVERALPGGGALDVLMSLCRRGLVRADSFAPVRALLQENGAHRAGRSALLRARTLSQGRWEAVRPLAAADLDTRLHRAFDACGIVNRDTLRAQPLAPAPVQAVRALRAWELTGRARRGYYVRGMSGVQFVRDGDFAAVTSRLQSSGGPVVWMCAADPLQPWGRVLPHVPERAFMRVPGTLVALRDGRVCAVLERRGEVLRVFEAEGLQEALAALGDDFERKRLLPAQSVLTVRQYAPESENALKAAGFTRMMNDYVKYRGSV